MGQKGEDTKEKIRAKAYRVFAEKGFKEVTMKDICLATGMSRGGLYRHYGSTQQIFREILESLMGAQKDEFEEKIKDKVPACEILTEVLERYRREMTDGESSLSTAIYEYYSGHKEEKEGHPLLEQYRQSWEMWKGLLQYGMDRGEFKRAEPQAVFDILIFSYQGVRMFSKIMPVGQEIPDRIVQQVKEILIP